MRQFFEVMSHRMNRLLVRFHTVNDFCFVVIIALLPGLCGHLLTVAPSSSTYLRSVARRSCLSFAFTSVSCIMSQLSHPPFSQMCLYNVLVLLSIYSCAALFVLDFLHAKVCSRSNVDLLMVGSVQHNLRLAHRSRSETMWELDSTAESESTSKAHRSNRIHARIF